MSEHITPFNPKERERYLPRQDSLPYVYQTHASYNMTLSLAFVVVSRGVERVFMLRYDIILREHLTSCVCPNAKR